MNKGDDTVKCLELAAVLANCAQETTGGWGDNLDEYTKWDLCRLCYFFMSVKLVLASVELDSSSDALANVSAASLNFPIFCKRSPRYL